VLVQPKVGRGSRGLRENLGEKSSRETKASVGRGGRGSSASCVLSSALRTLQFFSGGGNRLDADGEGKGVTRAGNRGRSASCRARGGREGSPAQSPPSSRDKLGVRVPVLGRRGLASFSSAALTKSAPGASRTAR